VTVRLAISVEGHTEKEFCQEVLRPHLLTFDVHIEPKIVVTKHNLSGPNAKGGALSVERFRNEVRRLLPSFDYVTTLYDFYGFRDRLPDETPDDLCLRMSKSLDQPRGLFPYVQVFEFEALLFAAPDVVAAFLQHEPLGEALSAIVTSCGGAEQINDDPESAPSSRLAALYHEHLGARYDKAFHGPLLALEIGIPAIRTACPRFDAWLSCLEALAGAG
jgi:hypothetical protein